MQTREPIFISQRLDTYADIGETREGLDIRLTEFVMDCGFIPAPVSVSSLAVIEILFEKVRPVGLVLSGGNDLLNSAARDSFEIKLLKICLSRKLPVLGICRGAQVINVFSGGTLCSRQNHVGLRHPVSIFDSKGQQTKLIVNSFHKFGIDSLADGLNAFAICESDSSVEGFVSNDGLVEGWMWHPERNSIFESSDISRAKRLFARGVAG